MPDKDKGKSIHEASATRLIPIVKNGVAARPSEKSTLTDSHSKLDELELRRTYRNMFAHFDPRAYKDEFIVFLTRSDFDARQILGEPLGDDGVSSLLWSGRASGLYTSISSRTKNGLPRKC